MPWTLAQRKITDIATLVFYISINKYISGKLGITWLHTSLQSISFVC